MTVLEVHKCDVCGQIETDKDYPWGKISWSGNPDEIVAHACVRCESIVRRFLTAIGISYKLTRGLYCILNEKMLHVTGATAEAVDALVRKNTDRAMRK